jgi:hypothetical protein
MSSSPDDPNVVFEPPPAQAPKAPAAPAAASPAAAPAAPDAAPPAAAPAPESHLPSTKVGLALYTHANSITTGVFVVMTGIWLLYMPWGCDSKYRLPEETDLCQKIILAEVAAHQPTTPTTGCPAVPATAKTSSRAQPGTMAGPEPVAVSWSRELPRMVLQPAASAAGQGQLDRVEELKTDLTVWERYEWELKTFQWGKDLNWYLYSTLRVLVIALSALTPALIVAPMLQKRKFIAALPAAIVAIAAGCISEFDFKNQAAAYTLAEVTVQGEKTAFVTRSQPWYDYVNGAATGKTAAPPKNGGTPGKTAPGADTATTPAGETTSSATPAPPTQVCGETTVPYPEVQDYDAARSNFSCRVQYAWQTQNLSRLLFLRGQQPPPAAGTPQPGANKPQGNPTGDHKGAA